MIEIISASLLFALSTVSFIMGVTVTLFVQAYLRGRTMRK